MNAQLTANAPASEQRGIDKLFAQMAGMYGSKFADLWAGVDAEQVKKVWVAGLAGVTGQEIAQGIDACMSRNFPPTLPEFRNLCRPPLDTHALMLVAMRELANRENRQPESWPSNRLFWAAQRIAYDLRTCDKPERMLKRFELAWFEAGADANKPIPTVADASALPAPGKTTISRDEAQKRANQIGLRVGGASTVEKIAHANLTAICDNAEKYPRCTIEYALKALQHFKREIPQKLVERARALGLEKLINEQEIAA